MSDEERAQMGQNARALSTREFDRDTLIRRLEGWLGTMTRDPYSSSISRGTQ
jgi:colanic acid biosynthesis glycosyl transferase WcaI